MEKTTHSLGDELIVAISEQDEALGGFRDFGAIPVVNRGLDNEQQIGFEILRIIWIQDARSGAIVHELRSTFGG
jgi:hypothetical protein